MKKLLRLFLIVIISASWNESFGQSLRINELMPSNSSTIKDRDNEFSDWFELKNTGTETLNLSEYFVTDDINNKSQWQFPSHELGSGEIILVFASGKDYKDFQLFDDLEHVNWQTIIDLGDYFKYTIPTDEIAGWRNPEFDDNDWLEGQSGFGYGDEDDATIIEETISLYLRKSFTLNNISDIENLLLHMDYDDGFVAYINGTEVARSSNLGTEGISPTFDEATTTDHEASIYLNSVPEPFIINDPQNVLNEGENTLAIEVHNFNISSSDFTAIPILSYSSENLSENSISDHIKISSQYLHTNFKLSSSGDSLLIYNTQQQLIDQLIYDPFPVVYSIGYSNNNFNELKLYAAPTPGETNTSIPIIYNEELTPTFSVPGGLYNSSLTVTLEGGNSVNKIYYTTDGSAPDKSSNLYSSSIQIQAPTTIRAKIITDNNTYGKTISQSYFPNYDKELPVVFVSTNPGNLWDNENGIYVKGDNAASSFPYFGANFWQDWEKPAHIDAFFPNDNKNFSIDGGIKIHGAYSRGQDQKSLSVYARKKYGDGDIDSQIFDNKNINEFESLILRSSGQDAFGESVPTGTIFRDMMMTRMAQDMNLDIQAGQAAILYINGEYWGIHNIREKTNEHFIVSNNLVDKNDIDYLEDPYQVIVGSNEEYVEMITFLENNNILQNQVYNYIQSEIDIDNYIRYNVAEIFYDNQDWPGNNLKYWRKNTGSGKWRWVVYDTDMGFGLWDVQNYVYNNTLELATSTDGDDWPNPPWSTYLLHTLLQREDFQNRFINTFADHLNTTFLTDSVFNWISYFQDQIYDEVPYHVEKWGSDFETWQTNVDDLYTFADLRPEITREHIRNHFSISQNQTVSIQVEGCNDASIQVNTIQVKNFPWDGIYFNEIPIELTALAPNGYRFVRWEGDIFSNEAIIELVMTSDMSVTAIFEENTDAIGVIINEIAYNASDEFDSGDWVELYNNSSNYVNLTDWILKDSKDDNQYEFEPNTTLAPHAYLVVCRNIESFTQVYPEVSNYQGAMEFGLSSNGDCVRLFNDSGILVDEVCFTSESPWPNAPDGDGPTLSLSNPDSNNSLANSWQASIQSIGSPGKDNSNPTGNSLLVKTQGNYLLQNYPNPFEGYTEIPLYSGKNQDVQLSIYNLQGQLVNVIYQGKLNEGFHTFEWLPAEKTSGIYIINYSGVDFSDNKKAIIK